jgi:sulfate adenylyltransferase
MSIILPHGGKLINRLVPKELVGILKEKANTLKKIQLNERQISDLELISIGAYSPLEGFMGKDDYRNVLHNMRLANGFYWTIPITLSVTEEVARHLKMGDDVALVGLSNEILAILHLKEIYSYNKELDAELIYGTTDINHPGVKALYEQGEINLGGSVSVIERPRIGGFHKYYLDPADTRREFEKRGWRTVVGFQTRNPIHRAHEYIQKCALEGVDGLFLHPLVGETKPDDIPATVRMKCYEVLFEKYYPKERTLIGIFPARMRYAGPREAVFHAIIRKNYGCTHFIVGRDHAGVGNYYGPYDAQRIFENFEPCELGIIPMFFDHAFYCKVCGNMASTKTCPHEKDAHIFLSGTKVREMLRAGKIPPKEFTRVEVAMVLAEWLKKAL